MKEYNGYLIVKVGNEFTPMGDVQKPSRLTTKHEVLEFENEDDYLAKISELGLVIDEEI